MWSIFHRVATLWNLLFTLCNVSRKVFTLRKSIYHSVKYFSQFGHTVKSFSHCERVHSHCEIEFHNVNTVWFTTLWRCPHCENTPFTVWTVCSHCVHSVSYVFTLCFTLWMSVNECVLSSRVRREKERDTDQWYDRNLKIKMEAYIIFSHLKYRALYQHGVDFSRNLESHYLT